MTPWDVVVAGDDGGQDASADALLALLPQTYSFTLDDDLVKVVTVSADGYRCHVHVRYGQDVVLQEETHEFDVASPISIETTRFGVIIRGRRRLPLLGWKVVRKF